MSSSSGRKKDLERKEKDLRKKIRIREKGEKNERKADERGTMLTCKRKVRSVQILGDWTIT